MSNEDKGPLKVVFSPGCFDSLDIDQAELDALMAEIQEKFANMTPEQLASESIALNEEDFDELPDDIKLQIESFGEKRNLQ
jgi:hypothetical protein